MHGPYGSPCVENGKRKRCGKIFALRVADHNDDNDSGPDAVRVRACAAVCPFRHPSSVKQAAARLGWLVLIAGRRRCRCCVHDVDEVLALRHASLRNKVVPVQAAFQCASSAGGKYTY